MKHKVADFLDAVLTFFCVSVLAILCVNYFTRNRAVILLSGLIVGLGITFLTDLLRKKKRTPTYKNEAMVSANQQFWFMTEEATQAYFLAAFSTRYRTEQKNGYLRVGNAAVALFMRPEKLTLAAISSVYARIKQDNLAAMHQNDGSIQSPCTRLIFLCAEEPDRQAAVTAPILPDIRVEIFAPERVYRLLCSLKAVPPQTVRLGNSTKAGIKALAMGALAKNKAKRYLLSALFLLAGAMLLPYGAYYIVMASLLIGTALLCRIDLMERLRKK